MHLYLTIDAIADLFGFYRHIIIDRYAFFIGSHVRLLPF